MMTLHEHSEQHLQLQLAIQEGLLLKGALEMSWSYTVFMVFKHNCHDQAKLPISCFLCLDLSCFSLLKTSSGFWVWAFQATVLWFSSEESSSKEWKKTSQRVEICVCYNYVLFGGSLPHEKAVKTELAFFC